MRFPKKFQGCLKSVLRVILRVLIGFPFLRCFKEVSGFFKGASRLFCFIVAWHLLQLPEQKEGLFAKMTRCFKEVS